MSYDHDDVGTPKNATIPLDEIIQNRHRRRFLEAGVGLLSFASLAPLTPAIAASAGRSIAHLPHFTGLPTSTADRVSVPDEFLSELLYAWGDPVSGGPRASADAADDAAAQAQQAGMHHDGMHFFPFNSHGKPSSSHGLLCINHEYTDDGLLHIGGMNPWTAEKVAKSKAAHGVSVIEIKRSATGWDVVRPSPWARRITADTLCQLSGPAAGNPLLQTRDDPQGRRVLGTLNNCAMGVTPWGTYLTCEENFNGYFRSSQPGPAHKRYGINTKGAGYRWHEFDPRFDVDQHPNECNRFGWVVEIDPHHPEKPPVKHTALGRFKHEGATVTLAPNGRVVVYMGDDEKFEYVYKFVSKQAYLPGKTQNPEQLLSEGTLYVARFKEDGSGQWIPLEHGNKGLGTADGFASQADILVHTRQAADAVGATPMDRPEWVAVHPKTGEVYLSLTNNNSRGTAERPGLNGANPRSRNIFGHILRWQEARNDAGALTFKWDIVTTQVLQIGAQALKRIEAEAFVPEMTR